MRGGINIKKVKLEIELVAIGLIPDPGQFSRYGSVFFQEGRISSTQISNLLQCNRIHSIGLQNQPDCFANAGVDGAGESSIAGHGDVQLLGLLLAVLDLDSHIL